MGYGTEVSLPIVIIVVAMAEEAEPFLARADRSTDPVRSGEARERWLVIDGIEVLLVQSGIGFVNAAAATARALLRVTDETGQDAALVVSAGTAGGLGVEVGIGDVVIGTEYVNIDADARVFGYRLGQVPGMPAVHAADERVLDLAARRWPEGSVQGALVPADATQAGAAEGGAADGGAADDPTGAGGWAVRVGPIGSSYAFVTAERAAIALEAFPYLDAVDMESSAIAQVCRSHGIGFAAVRGISDMATAEAAADHLANTPDTATRSADIALDLVRHLLAGA